MMPDQINTLLTALLEGKLSREQVVARIGNALPTADLGDVKVDLDRERRCGFPEVVFGEGKSAATIERTIRRLNEAGHEALVTRASPNVANELAARIPQLRHNEVARTLRSGNPRPKHAGLVTVITAGTTDLPVAEEARETLDWMGIEAELVADVGVAGPHRLVEQLSRIEGRDAVVVVAGMEAALPSVVAGYVDCPVIGVPTSVGYGANLGGITALLSMLNSCAANVVVVNIDAGFKGGYVAGMIARRKQ